MPGWPEKFKNLPWETIYAFVVGPAVLTMPAGRLIYILVKDIKLCLIAGYIIGWLIITVIYYFVYHFDKQK